MAFEDWATNPDGTIKVFPLVAYDSFVPFGMMCGLRLHYAETDAKLLAGEAEAVPLIMTVAQAREMAGVLTRLADKAERSPSGETPQ